MASKLLDELLDEMKKTNYKPEVKIYSDEFYFGRMVGQIIVDKYLLNVDVDSMYKHIIRVSTEEFNEAERLRDFIYSQGYSQGFEEFRKVNHKIWLDYVDSLAIKYLPETITCTFDLPEFVVTEDIQKGIENAIWNCDFSRYWLDNLVGQTINKNNPIILKLQIR